MMNKVLNLWDNIFDKLGQTFLFVKKYALMPAPTILKWLYLSLFFSFFWFATFSMISFTDLFSAVSADDFLVNSIFGLFAGFGFLVGLHISLIVITYFTSGIVIFIKRMIITFKNNSKKVLK